MGPTGPFPRRTLNTRRAEEEEEDADQDGFGTNAPSHRTCVCVCACARLLMKPEHEGGFRYLGGQLGSSVTGIVTHEDKCFSSANWKFAVIDLAVTRVHLFSLLLNNRSFLLDPGPFCGPVIDWKFCSV